MAWYDYTAIAFVALLALGIWRALRGVAKMDRLDEELAEKSPPRRGGRMKRDPTWQFERVPLYAFVLRIGRRGRERARIVYEAAYGWRAPMGLSGTYDSPQTLIDGWNDWCGTGYPPIAPEELAKFKEAEEKP